MKRLIIIFFIALVCSITGYSQNNLYHTSNGKIKFFSKAPIEDISAQNNTVVSLINIKSKEVVVRMNISMFQFANKLMQEHFNENYLESDKYPVSTFQGKIKEDIAFDKPGTYEVSATGKINIHGKILPKTIIGKLEIGENIMRLDAKFDVLLRDHNIKIPKLLFSNIAEKIDVTCQFNYQPFKKK